MKHETPTIQAKLRDRIGSRYSQRLRKAGRLPGVIYGHKANPVAVSVDEKEMLTVLRHGTHVVNINVEGGESQTCLVKDLQFGYLGDNVIHIDLARVDLDEEVTVHVALHFVGEPKGAKSAGAVVSHPMTELEIVCRVTDIPDEIRVDLSSMEDVFTVSDLVLPAGVRTTLDAGTPIAQITFVSEAEEGEAVAVEGAAEPEVITGAKSEEEKAD
ncbi:MAG TPA: 50S ribosomal protein L25 [Phycisphaerales bacterium]|nr:50S ribosomal protein L25 [Phycisphaerales bacterium]HRQ74840.1 50S ribosomal protein L25 [Phycisphaerales bacterium]